ncbi:hypothetical protein B5M09_004779 [Aphanomyces astaci]|uniref:CBM1 domain-containing protein n=1 Tax=Aphanomyces astaci TaxID=112090 RepID=A0A425DID2_APHAT|nr:hypothetical protein B5M09_004779 [Aphanomyces astaci]
MKGLLVAAMVAAAGAQTITSAPSQAPCPTPLDVFAVYDLVPCTDPPSTSTQAPTPAPSNSTASTPAPAMAAPPAPTNSTSTSTPTTTTATTATTTQATTPTTTSMATSTTTNAINTTFAPSQPPCPTPLDVFAVYDLVPCTDPPRTTTSPSQAPTPAPSNSTSTPTTATPPSPTTTKRTPTTTKASNTTRPVTTKRGNSPVCTLVSVKGDATYCIPGSICRGWGDHVYGTDCPVKGDVAIKYCFKSLKSYTQAGKCIAPHDAVCSKLRGGVWGCKW